MGARVLEKDGVGEFLSRWARSQTVVVPGPGPEYDGFVPWDGHGVGLPPVSTRKSIKDAVFARSDALFRYREEDGDVILRETLPEGEVLVFGARPCDARGIKMLDPVFIEDPDLHDPAYKARRERIAIIAVACNSPGPACFCQSVGGDPHGEEGADVLLTDVGDRYVAKAVTDKGNRLLADLDDASEADLKRAEQVAEEARRLMEKAFDVEGVKEKLDGLFEHDLWKRIHEKCLGCGVCTYLCPTCHCFDVTDEERTEGYTRFRNWDSCQFALFTLHTSGHNPRPTQMERLRQRFMHKFNYYPNKYGEPACVGCGRCIINCPVNLDIREVIREIGGGAR